MARFSFLTPSGNDDDDNNKTTFFLPYVVMHINLSIGTILWWGGHFTNAQFVTKYIFFSTAYQKCARIFFVMKTCSTTFCTTKLVESLSVRVSPRFVAGWMFWVWEKSIDGGGGGGAVRATLSHTGIAGYLNIPVHRAWQLKFIYVCVCLTLKTF